MSKVVLTTASIYSTMPLAILRTPRFLSRSIIVTALIATSGCSQQNSQAITLDVDNRQTYGSQEAIERQKKQDVAEIEENIKNSYARLAAQRADVCPKLLQKDIDSDVIERVQEVMTSDYCDYYLYPQVNQHIAVTLSDDKVEALLIVPDLHNFVDGDYQVDSYDKHVIRLAYNGTTSRPEDFSYDVIVKLLD